MEMTQVWHFFQILLGQTPTDFVFQGFDSKDKVIEALRQVCLFEDMPCQVGKLDAHFAAVWWFYYKFFINQIAWI